MPLIKKNLIPLLKDKIRKHEFLLTAEVKFDAAHRLSNYKGQCSRLHGHTYRVIVTVKSKKLNNWGAVMDFGDLKKIFKKVIEDKYDHKTILLLEDSENQAFSKVVNEDWITWMNKNPTAENMARDIWKNLTPHLQRFKNINKLKGIKLDSVTVYETTTNSATYKEKV